MRWIQTYLTPTCANTLLAVPERVPTMKLLLSRYKYSFQLNSVVHVFTNSINIHLAMNL